MTNMRVLIAAAGEGRRSGLPYPKTLHSVLGKPILVRLLELFRPIDDAPAIVVSPRGRDAVQACLRENGLNAVLIDQEQPTGMGDAVLEVRQSPQHAEADHLLVVWGDIPLIEPATVDTLISTHLAHDNAMTFPTRRVSQAYTMVERDTAGAVRSLIETREMGIEPGPGERDIGLFVIRPRIVFDLLEQRLPGAIGSTTGEHGFLYVVRHLVAAGHRVEALPIATERDIVSLNRLSDLDAIEPRPPTA